MQGTCVALEMMFEGKRHATSIKSANERFAARVGKLMVCKDVLVSKGSPTAFDITNVWPIV